MATIQGVYVALFGRPADPTGLAYFNGVTKNGADLSKIGDLASTQEYKDRFAGQSNTQIITAIYQSLFNRAPEAAGLEFFANALTKGTLNINNIAIAILDGAQGDDKTTVTNKITAADNFTKALDTGTEQAAYTGNTAAQQGRNFLTPVTKDTGTIPNTAATDKAIADIVATPGGTTPTTGVVINLTSATDVVATNAANPAFKSTSADDTINGTHATVGDNLKIDAGLGNDTFIIKATAALASSAPTLSGVEKIVVTADTGAAALALTNASGVKEVSHAVSTAATAKDVTFTDIAVGTTLNVTGKAGAAAANTTFGFKAADVTGSNDSATLVLKAADINTNASTITIGAIENLTVNVDGNSLASAVVASAATSLTVTGSGNLTIGGAGSDLKLVNKVDASALNGQLTLDLNTVGSTVAVTVTGTKFADTIKLSGTTNADKIVYNAANKSTVSVLDSITGFETAKDKIDVSSFKATLTGTHSVTAFTVAANANPTEGQSFLGNAVGFDATNKVAFFDVDGNGSFNAATDLAVKLDVATFSATDNVIWA